MTRVRESISENLILTLRTDTAYDCCNASNSISGGQPIRGDRDFMQALRLPTSVAGEMWMLVARGIVHNVTPNTVFTWQRLNDSLLDQPVEGAISDIVMRASALVRSHALWSMTPKAASSTHVVAWLHACRMPVRNAC